MTALHPDVAFTGTRAGMTRVQSTVLYTVLSELAPMNFRHGCAVGADTEAAILVKRTLPGVRIIGYPSTDHDFAARWRFVDINDLEQPADTNFARNRRLVHDSQILVATPYHECRQSRGGTWHAVDYALKLNRPVYIIYPSGKQEALNVPEPEKGEDR